MFLIEETGEKFPVKMRLKMEDNLNLHSEEDDDFFEAIEELDLDD